jgi:uncharacterized repeat protein (TIGR01451 family)
MLVLAYAFLLTLAPAGRTQGTSLPVQMEKSDPARLQFEGGASSGASRATADLSRLKAPFMRNHGQVENETVKFLGQIQGGTVFVADDEITYAVFDSGDRGSADSEARRREDEAFADGGSRTEGSDQESGQAPARSHLSLTGASRGKPDDAAAKGWVLKERLVGARDSRAEGIKPSPTRVSYHTGRDAARWRSNIPTYEEVSLGEVYEGVRLNLSARGRSLEKIFVLASGAKPDEIIVRLDGANGLRVNASGELEIETGIGAIRMSAPFAYQDIDGKRIQVEAAYRVNPEDNSYGFQVADYQRDYPLVIDPSLIASTFIGGSSSEVTYAMAFAGDGSGDIYIAGTTGSLDYPVTAGAYDRTNTDSGGEAFVSRLSGDLSTLQASTFIGGNRNPYAGPGYTRPLTLKVDGSGNVIIAGWTNTPDFPVTEGAFDTVFHGNYNAEAFVSKLDSGLSTLIASTFTSKGANGGYHNAIHSLALDSSGSIYVAGIMGGGAPAPEGYDETSNGGLDGFVAVLSADLTAMSAFTFIGGTADDHINAILIDPSDGSVLVAGNAGSQDFPVTPGAYDTKKETNWSIYKGFIARFNPSLKKLLASTYLGGNQNNDILNTMVLTPSGDILVAGNAQSADYPTTLIAYDTTHNGWADAVVSKMNRFLTKLIASTFIGQSGAEEIHSIALDASGAVFVCGETTSSNFPVTLDGYSTTYRGGYEVFVSKFDANLSLLAYSTYIGGSAGDYGKALLLDQDETFIIAGDSNSPDWPTTEGAFDTTNGYWNAVVARLTIPELLWVDVWGSRRIFQGEQGDFVVSYKNSMKQVAKDVVVVVDILTVLPFISATGGGIYYVDNEGRNHIYWRLGDLDPQEKGDLTFKIKAPWGLSGSEIGFYARIGATNYPWNSFEIEKFLDHVPSELVSSRALSDNEIYTKLATNKDLRDTYNYALEIGYMFFNVATSSLFSDGSELLTFYLMSSKDGAFTVLSNLSGKTFGLVLRDNSYSLFGKSGGYTVDNNQQTFATWGTWPWAQPAQESSPDLSDEEGEGVFSASGKPEDEMALRCLGNCMFIEGIKNFIEGMIPGYNAMEAGVQCTVCIQSIRAGKADADACKDCTFNLTGMMIPAGKTLLELHHLFHETSTGCIIACSNDPSSYSCNFGDEKTYCCNTATRDAVCSATCMPGGVWFTGVAGARGFECFPRPHIVCSKGRCATLQTAEGEGYKSSTADTYSDIGVSHDPNAKLADIKGEIVAGKRINYTIQYENTGAGTAYQVFVLDKLPNGLDEKTLKINDGGKYSKSIRSLYWAVGDVGPGQQGEVTFSSEVEKDAADGTEIVNWAEVHFPSANEVTPTNPVVNVVRSLAANPQFLEATAGTPLKIVLSGQGPKDLAYRLLSTPLNGSLKGTPPNITYTSNVNFSGMDSFAFAVTSGKSQSNSAEVQMRVNPSPLDNIPPRVLKVYPANGSEGVVFSTEQAQPDVYSPFIEATFSEQIDPATLTGATFTVSGLTGVVSYNVSLQKAIFTPSIPLSYGQMYTATLNTEIRDMAGNPLEASYSWIFTTAGSASLAVTLPGELDYLLFGELSVNRSMSQIISLSNRGSAALDIQSIKIAGEDSSLFTVGRDACSGETLANQETCSLELIFRPKSKGRAEALLQITSNDTLNPVVEVRMQGTGVAGKPDLTGRWKSLTQTCDGEKCRIRGVFKERNKGSRKAGPSLTRFFLSDDAVLDSGDILLKESVLSSLQRKKMKTIRVAAGIQGNASGKYVIGVVDATKAVVEASEKNNNVVSGAIP